MSSEVAVAQAALNVALQHQQRERHDNLVRELQETTTRLEEQRTEYAELRQRVIGLRARRRKLQDNLSILLGEEAEHSASKPRIADHVPSAPSVIAWHKAGERLASQRAAITKELSETQIVAQMDCDLARLTVEIQRLEFSEHNLVSALESMKPPPFLNPISEPPQGGISRVAWK